MSNISNRQKVGAIAAIGAAAVFGVLSFGNTAQAANYSHNCHLLAASGLTCCDHTLGSRLINVTTSCQNERKIVHTRKRPRPNIPPIRLLPEGEYTNVLEATRYNGSGDSGDGGTAGGQKSKGPNDPK